MNDQPTQPQPQPSQPPLPNAKDYTNYNFAPNYAPNADQFRKDGARSKEPLFANMARMGNEAFRQVGLNMPVVQPAGTKAATLIQGVVDPYNVTTNIVSPPHLLINKHDLHSTHINLDSEFMREHYQKRATVFASQTLIVPAYDPPANTALANQSAMAMACYACISQHPGSPPEINEETALVSLCSLILSTLVGEDESVRLALADIGFEVEISRVNDINLYRAQMGISLQETCGWLPASYADYLYRTDTLIAQNFKYGGVAIFYMIQYIFKNMNELNKTFHDRRYKALKGLLVLDKDVCPTELNINVKHADTYFRSTNQHVGVRRLIMTLIKSMSAVTGTPYRAIMRMSHSLLNQNNMTMCFKIIDVLIKTYPELFCLHPLAGEIPNIMKMVSVIQSVRREESGYIRILRPDWMCQDLMIPQFRYTAFVTCTVVKQLDASFVHYTEPASPGQTIILLKHFVTEYMQRLAASYSMSILDTESNSMTPTAKAAILDELATKHGIGLDDKMLRQITQDSELGKGHNIGMN